MMRPSRSLPTFALLVALAPGCDSAEQQVKAGGRAAAEASKKALDASKDKASELADKTADKAAELADKTADKAAELGNEAVDASKKAAGELADATKDAFEDLTNDGELSPSAKAWLAARAADASDASDSVESVLVKGVQLAPVAVEASKLLAEAIDRDTAIEPIFQKASADRAKIDAAIGKMPRVEVVDDVTVGFQKMDAFDGADHVEQRGYLVMWRYEDHLVGFVYRSKQTVDVDALVAETPRLIALTQKALAD
ncbi:MAG: hypothetical protein K0V04_12835 [Deltaproteobacteria bacterium]|nr:hypothetical protein [Deltaproteobacteria bacterium]